MFLSRPPTGGSPRNAGAGEGLPLYDPDELELLRDELLEAYSTDRTQILTRDEITEQRRTLFAVREAERVKTGRKEKDEATILELRAKQAALTRLYENVIFENETKDNERKQRRKKKKDESEKSSESFHKLYTVYRDPVSGAKGKALRHSDGMEGDDIWLEEGKGEGGKALSEKGVVKVLDAAAVSEPAPPSKEGGEQDKMTESSGKERSKFVLKKRLSSLQSKPPPLLEGHQKRTSKEMRDRRDTRYSEEKGRFSFDVDVAGPFFNFVEKRHPRMRNVATQVFLHDGTERKSGDFGSQVDVESFSWGDKRGSRDTKRDSDDFGDEWSWDGADEEEQAGGDASSSNPSERESQAGMQEGTISRKSDSQKGKELERKESKRREAETMARPRGYRDLDLREPIPFVTFEAETHVTAHDLDREEARGRGMTTFPRDNILWPTCSEIDMDLAGKKIEDYIKRCWTLDPKWLFNVQPLEVYHDSYRKKYVFEAKFSVPSPTTPVPPATASVFFVFEIPIYTASRNDEVKVTYVLEGTRFPHSPGKIPFQEKWLWGIIQDKLRIQKAMNF